MLRCYPSACNFQDALDAALLPFTRTVFGGCEKIFCHTGTIDAAWSALKDYIPNSLSSHSRNLLLYCKRWQIEVHRPSCQLAEKTLETLKRIFWEKAARRQALHEPMKISCGKKRKRPKNGSNIWGPKHCRNRCFATAPHSCLEKHVVLRARFPLRRDVYVCRILFLRYV